jgi:hypothetical protein
MSKHFLQEAMTAEEISEAQTDHYNIDDYFRRTMYKLTLEQKRKVADFVNELTKEV